MTFRLKLVGIILLIIMVVPIIGRLGDDAGVLGVVDDTSEDSINDSNGNVGSGAIDIITIEDEEKPQLNLYEGKILWEEDMNVEAKSDKLKLGTSVSILFEEKRISTVVGDTQVLTEDVILIVSKDVFTRLGGDPDKQDYIEVEVLRD